MNWLNNLKSISLKKISGECPFCKSNNTDYTFTEISNGMGCGTIWCNNCRKAYHISRMKIQNGYKLNDRIPDNLIFTN